MRTKFQVGDRVKLHNIDGYLQWGSIVYDYWYELRRVAMRADPGITYGERGRRIAEAREDKENFVVMGYCSGRYLVGSENFPGDFMPRWLPTRVLSLVEREEPWD